MAATRESRANWASHRRKPERICDRDLHKDIARHFLSPAHKPGKDAPLDPREVIPSS